MGYCLCGGRKVSRDTNDIVCEDADGDGYFNWGIGPRPSNIPSWAEMEEDGDDSDDTKGQMYSTGHLEDLQVGTNIHYITSTQNISSDCFERNPIVVQANGRLVITNTMHCYRGVSVTLQNGGVLEIDGGMLHNVILNAQYGSTIIIRNGGVILCNPQTDVIEVPLGVNLEIDDGELKFIH